MRWLMIKIYDSILICQAGPGQTWNEYIILLIFWSKLMFFHGYSYRSSCLDRNHMWWHWSTITPLRMIRESLVWDLIRLSDEFDVKWLLLSLSSITITISAHYIIANIVHIIIWLRGHRHNLFFFFFIFLTISWLILNTLNQNLLKIYLMSLFYS